MCKIVGGKKKSVKAVEHYFVNPFEKLLFNKAP